MHSRRTYIILKHYEHEALKSSFPNVGYTKKVKSKYISIYINYYKMDISHIVNGYMLIKHKITQIDNVFQLDKNWLNKNFKKVRMKILSY